MEDGKPIADPAEEFMDRAAEIHMAWLDITPLALALEAEYQRGLEEGGKQIDTKAVEGAAYERGRAEMRAEILATITGAKTAQGPLKIESSNTTLFGSVLTIDDPGAETATAVKSKLPVLGADEIPADPNRRPEGIPSTFAMFQIILREKPGQLVARELAQEIARRWWPGLKYERLGPDISTSVTKGRIHRDADGKLRLTEKGDKIDATDNRGMAKTSQPPQPKKADIPQPRGGVGTRLFVCERRDPIPLLNAEWSVADTLYRAMGKGFVDISFLATKVWGHARGEDTQARLAALISTLNPKLAEIGLAVEYHKGFGYVMKETA